MIPRRRFLSAALVGLTAKADRNVAGGFVNDSAALGHRIRDGAIQATPRREESFPIVIAGGGIAGLSAAWRLKKKGFSDFILLEMERQAGGNSRWGENDITAYPWAAHYIPIPNKESVLTRELLEDLGVLLDGEWREEYLCFTPQERLFLHGRWQDGLEPDIGLSKRDREQRRRFDDLIAAERATGQYTIPVESGAGLRELDRIDMTTWLRQNGIDSPYVHWSVDYACRDDYGAHARDTSAWAGIHYFASRENEELGPLTWPEGNGWVARRMIEKLKPHIRTGEPVIRIQRTGNALSVITPSAKYRCARLVFAAPTFLCRYLMEDAPAIRLEYSPWVTANLVLDRMPRETHSEPAWDNVIYNSPSLGYVVATHMGLQSRTDRSVWTWYFAMADGTPSASRKTLLDQPWTYWRDFILDDLSRAHPDIRACVSRIDVMRMGHAMVRPVPGTMFSPRPPLRPPVFLANSDLSGISIFEEAQYRGVRAADAALKSL